MKKHVAHSLILTLFGFVAACDAQGTLEITFDHPPGGRGMDYFMQHYSESDLFFKPLTGSVGFGLVTTQSPGLPDNGSCYLQAGTGNNLTFSLLSCSQVFSLNSVDLAGLNSSTPNFTVNFIGYRAEGGTVTTSFTGSGIDFQTFHFGSDWSDLTQVEIPNSNWSLDNVVIAVPEPNTCGLLVAGSLAWRFHKAKRASSKR